MSIVLAAHGTRSKAGQETIAQVVSQVARVSGDDVHVGWVDVLEPTLGDVLADLEAPVVVPWLVGGGYHLSVDVYQVVERSGSGAVVTEPLGESPALISALLDRLAGVDDAGPVVLAWAGSSVTEARRRVARIAARLAAVTGRPIESVALAAGVERAQEVVAALTTERPPVVLSLLLAPGFFHDRAKKLGGVITDPIGAHPAVVDWAAGVGAAQLRSVV